MKVELRFALASFIASSMLALQFAAPAGAGPPPSTPDPTPTQAPSASPVFAPIGESQPAAPAATGTAAPKILGHQIVSAFCSTFVTRFNVAATTMLVDDKLLDDATAAETDYENDFFKLDGAIRSWDHRLAMIAALGQILRTIPQTQTAVNDLRAQAKASPDADRRQALIEGASHLQTSLDHQRIVANEMTDAVGAMLDLHSTEDTLGHEVHSLLDARQKFNIDPGDAPVPHPGDSLPVVRKDGSYGTSAVAYILNIPRDRQIVANSESNAATAVTRVVHSCDQEMTRLQP